MVILQIPRLNQYEQFIGDCLDINDLKSVYPPEWKNLSNRQITIFPIPLPLNDIKYPFLNNSKETIAELNDLSVLSFKRNKNQTSFYTKFNNVSIDQYWINYAGMNHLKYSNEYITKLVTDLETFIINIKMIYNRPRPCILAYLHGIQLNAIQNSCDNSPSYPSKSTFISNIVSFALIKLNPDRETEINALYKKIELINLYSGTHYKSDLDVANQIADIVKPYVKLALI